MLPDLCFLCTHGPTESGTVILEWAECMADCRKSQTLWIIMLQVLGWALSKYKCTMKAQTPSRQPKKSTRKPDAMLEITCLHFKWRSWHCYVKTKLFRADAFFKRIMFLWKILNWLWFWDCKRNLSYQKYCKKFSDPVSLAWLRHLFQGF